MKQDFIDYEKIEKAVRDILEAIGEDLDRDGLKNTPNRIARMYNEIFSGLHEDPSKYLEVCFEEDKHGEIVIVKDIPFYSMCEHHLMPFYGKVDVAYIPTGKVTGLSKLARVVETIAKRPQLQERLTSQIADVILKSLNPMGVMVIVKAEHMCMTMRGVKKPGSKTVTYAATGCFKKDSEARAEVINLINLN